MLVWVVLVLSAAVLVIVIESVQDALAVFRLRARLRARARTPRRGLALDV